MSLLTPTNELVAFGVQLALDVINTNVAVLTTVPTVVNTPGQSSVGHWAYDVVNASLYYTDTVLNAFFASNSGGVQIAIGHVGPSSTTDFFAERAEIAATLFVGQDSQMVPLVMAPGLICPAGRRAAYRIHGIAGGSITSFPSGTLLLLQGLIRKWVSSG